MRLTGVNPCGALILIIAMGLATAATPRTGAAAGPPETTAPPGLGSVHTIVATTGANGSVDTEALQADVQTAMEARLRSAGIRVAPALPTRLVVFVDLFGEDDQTGCRATIDVGVHEFALPSGTPPSREASPVETHHALWAACAEIDRLVRDDTNDLVNRFITTYLDSTPAATADVARDDR